MLCYLRYPGRALRAGERLPAALLAFVAEQIGVLPDSIDEYLAAKRNCWRHAIECQRQLGLRPFGKKAAAELTELFDCHWLSKMTRLADWRRWRSRRAGNAKFGSVARRRRALLRRTSPVARREVLSSTDRRPVRRTAAQA